MFWIGLGVGLVIATVLFICTMALVTKESKSQKEWKQKDAETKTELVHFWQESLIAQNQQAEALRDISLNLSRRGYE